MKDELLTRLEDREVRAMENPRAGILGGGVFDVWRFSEVGRSYGWVDDYVYWWRSNSL